MKKLISYILLLSITITGCNQKSGQCEFPSRPNPPRLVNDFASVFSDQEKQQLEQITEAYASSTSTQIVIVTTNDLCEYDKSTYAFKIIDDWGVGQEEEDNGLVLLLKPKETAVDGRGDMFIATGRGLEGAIPDITANHIVNDFMIPRFKQQDYYGGIITGLNECMKLADKDFAPTANVSSPGRKKDFGKMIGPLIVVILIFVFVFFGNSGQVSSYARKNHIPWWTAWWILSSRGNRGSGGGFFGGGGGGFGGGGFGGFGGGSSGGGGSGGSW